MTDKEYADECTLKLAQAMAINAKLRKKLDIVTKAMEEHGCFCQGPDDCDVEKPYLCMGHDIEKQWANL